ncbi:MAG: 4Fe-4S ferredoxin, partial [Clostridiales bacterium]|nr:4Fe-4S ferredoxin [Clostridiales bacterium]
GDVDTKEKEKEKLDAAIETLGNINKIIIDRITGIFNIEKGIFPWLLTGVINPMFNKKAIDTSHFYSNESCTGCGICEKVCNCNNIRVNERPVWGNKCTQCLACVHYCPVNASQYGKSTHKKGRYTNPNIRIEEIMK